MFDLENRVAIHEAGHAVIGWIMKMHCDPSVFEGIFQIFHYYRAHEDRIIGVCHFHPNRATNESADAVRKRSQNEAIADLAINIAGVATYTAYLDERGDPEYPIKEMEKYFSKTIGNKLIGKNHDFRYFSDIARFDLGVRDSEVVIFAEKFNVFIVNILKLASVRESIKLVADELVRLLNTNKNSLDLPDLERLESVVFPKLELESVAIEIQRLKSFISASVSQFKS